MRKRVSACKASGIARLGLRQRLLRRRRWIHGWLRMRIILLLQERVQLV